MSVLQSRQHASCCLGVWTPSQLSYSPCPSFIVNHPPDSPHQPPNPLPFVGTPLTPCSTKVKPQSISQMPMRAFLFPLYVYPLQQPRKHPPADAPTLPCTCDLFPLCSCSLLCSSLSFLCKQLRRCPVLCLCPWPGPAGSGSRNQNQPRAAPARSSADLAATVGLKTLLWGSLQAVIRGAKYQKGHTSRFRALVLEKR